MASEELSPEIENLVEEIATKNNIINYLVETNKKVSNEGDGYIGILNGLTMIDKDSDKKIKLVVKKAPANENLRSQFPTRPCFLNEICMYDQIFPELFAFQQDYNIPNPFKSIPKIYGHISDEFKETLLLENLKEDGYQLCTRQEPLDSHHLSLVVTEYAKLHAISHAMRRLEPERFEKLKELLGENIMERFQKLGPSQENQDDSSGSSSDKTTFGLDPVAVAEMFFMSTMKAIKNRSPKVLEAVKKFKENLSEYMYGLPDLKEEYKVIGHGDCWSANMLFKYEDQNLPKIPTKICLIDWQMAMINTPIHDLSYSLFISSGKKDLENYMTYLHIYHTALSESLAAFGLDPEEVYSFKLLEQQFREQCKCGFIMNIVMLEQTLSEGKTHDFEELANEGKSIMHIKDTDKEPSDLFKQRMGDLVEFLVEHEFI